MQDAVKSYADICLERASKATEGPWSTLQEEHEVHAISFTDAAGDPLHIAQWIPQVENAEFIAHSRTDVVELANRLKRACEFLRMRRKQLMLTSQPGTALTYKELADELEAPLEGEK